ncbi:phytoene desaturase family protein [Truepera radiovictrix]|uniref:Fumarate reductase/succinate dehydrogenase flavoprotein domain protein n=1 Tax=Truepera radiovictrix (strain DSM 17093 / CIP 108686 / LMG 22925 / RQ-24) TaxID=649638 RepID=D7CVW6_TRURR|nr:NAD(P)/FAD-dependent oxidoreductase [Truepera radiovictrix]ADI14229.1 fumarate reductase/succinate dehydrogenase flavoprotein domain protein [Truepera radiovictrix DSM 17093]WMT57214.1 NAD(P)/FAD-dependent oxidoreductase [Truepera radiovictrix]
MEAPYAQTEPSRDAYDAVVVGSGPNGLAAAITLARAGLSVVLLEAKDAPGGGLRSAELTLPGFTHDLCSAIHPFGRASPFFRSLPLEAYGLSWVEPPLPLAHPLGGGDAVVLERSLEATSDALGRDGAAYRWLMAPPARHWEALADDILGPLLRVPRHPVALARFGVRAGPSASWTARALFREERARALFAGLAAHTILPLERLTTSAIAVVLGALGHAVGWPFPRGGAQSLADALVRFFTALGGEVVVNAPVHRVDALPRAKAVFFDLTPRQLVAILGERLPARYRRRLLRYRYGAGAFKVDYALSGPVPWLAEACSRAGTVHLGGTLAEIAHAEREVARARHPARPYVLVAQQSLFDPTRAPAGQHTLWAYCHVPHGSAQDMTRAIEAQLERFAPGFGARVIAKSVRTPAELERYNPNYLGGDISGGVNDLLQLLARPVLHPNPYRTPATGVYLCSASTPPGGGVHGMAGFNAARRALAEVWGVGASAGEP